jgi:uncharacterized protein
MAFAQARNRIIPGAVATVGVSDRVAFLRRTYGTLGIALIAWAALTAGLMRFATNFSLSFSEFAFKGNIQWLIVLGLFMVVGYGAQRLAQSSASRGVQYAGLGLAVIAEAVILQPLLWVALLKFGNPAEVIGVDAANKYVWLSAGAGGGLIAQAALITIAIFVGLTLTVFITKKDFSFLRGALTIGFFAVIGVILASMLFGFTLGAFFAGAVILLMAGYILFQTSLVMKEFPPTMHIAAALMLFSTIATLFWYVLYLLMSLRGND